MDAWTPYTDSFGSWITTYEPIADKNGRNVGAIGVDISADYVNQVRSDILFSGAIAFVASYILIFLLVYWLSGLLTRPIVSLAGIASDIGDGNYEQEWSRVELRDTFRDEIDTLTNVFHSMVDKVAEREKSLRARVAQLEIMIDRSKLESTSPGNCRERFLPGPAFESAGYAEPLQRTTFNKKQKEVKQIPARRPGICLSQSPKIPVVRLSNDKIAVDIRMADFKQTRNRCH